MDNILVIVWSYMIIAHVYNAQGDYEGAMAHVTLATVFLIGWFIFSVMQAWYLN